MAIRLKVTRLTISSSRSRSRERWSNSLRRWRIRLSVSEGSVKYATVAKTANTMIRNAVMIDMGVLRLRPQPSAQRCWGKMDSADLQLVGELGRYSRRLEPAQHP